MPIMPGRLDRSQPPRPEAVRQFVFPRFERHRLASGLSVLLAPIDRTPLVDLRLLTPAGAHFDPPGQSGLAHLASAVQDEGTATRTGVEIAQSIEQVGGYLSTGVDWETGSVNCGVLASHLDTALELMADVASAPSFPEAEVTRLKAQVAAEIDRRRTQPAAIANKHLVRRVFGDGVYGRRIIGEKTAVESLDGDRLRSFYREHFTADASVLIITGSIDPSELLPRLEALAADWPAFPPPDRPRFDARDLDGLEVTIVDRPDAPQTELRMGHVGLPRRHPDYIATAVMNCLLGGRFMSRININLRERHGYTYGASSSFARRSGAGPFVVSTAVTTEHTRAAAQEILDEMTRLQNEPVGTEELAETKSYLLGTFPYTTQTLEGVTARLYSLAVFDLGDDYYDTFPNAISAVEPADILRSARGHLSPDRIALVAVGPRAQLEPELQKLGPVRIGD